MGHAGSMFGVRIAGTGSYLPANVVSNADLAKKLETTDEWIASRTGIKQRHFAAPDEASSHMALKASRAALEVAGVAGEDLDLIVCCTMTPDYIIPATSALLGRDLGAKKAGGFDLWAACSGFVVGLQTVSQYLKTGAFKKALLVGVEKMTTVIDPLDRGTAVIFADGAGAAVLVADETRQSDLLAFRQGMRGDDDVLVITHGGSRKPIDHEALEKRDNYVKMKGREVYRFAVTTFIDLIEGTCKDAGVDVKDLHLVVPHQVNMRIIEAACDRFGLPLEKVIVNIDRVGNTSAASVGIALDEAARAGRIKRGDLMLTLAFGAGLAWASALVRW